MSGKSDTDVATPTGDDGAAVGMAESMRGMSEGERRAGEGASVGAFALDQAA
jgi:hypothetical protein